MDRCFFLPKRLFLNPFTRSVIHRTYSYPILTYTHNPSYSITKNPISTEYSHNRQTHTNHVCRISTFHLPRHGKTSIFVIILRFLRHLHTRSVMCSNHIAATTKDHHLWYNEATVTNSGFIVFAGVFCLRFFRRRWKNAFVFDVWWGWRYAE